MNRALFPAVILVLGSVTPAMARTEEPRHTVAVREGAFEVRDYAPHVVAEVMVPEGRGDPGNAGFRPLAGYIFGGNAPKAKIAMTAPVTTQRGGAKIAMTAPVTTNVAGNGMWSVRFVMPAGETLDTLPAPLDPNVRLIAQPARRYAVVRFSGLTGDGTMERQTSALRAFMAARNLTSSGAPVIARYDPPWTLPMMRRNEVWLEVAR